MNEKKAIIVIITLCFMDETSLPPSLKGALASSRRPGISV